MNVDFTKAMAGIGTLMAAATHDLKTANPGDVGLNGVSIRAWREAYVEGCKDMANKVAASFPEEQYPAIKEAVMAAFRVEFDRLKAVALSSTHRGSES